MKTPTFREQYDKIVGAYLRNELIPTECTACFVGNLLNREDVWACARSVSKGKVEYYDLFFYDKSCSCVKNESNDFYTYEEIVEIERIFLSTIQNSRGYLGSKIYTMPDYEGRLYKAMEVTLLHLKSLHESKGEIVEDYKFTKRQLHEKI